MSRDLLRSLSTLLPSAEICLVSERPWHSLTFSGTQIELSAIISAADHLEMAARFEQILLDSNFNVGNRFVADIAVTNSAAGDNETHLAIHALLLDA
jgi:hypothetical protein